MLISVVAGGIIGFKLMSSVESVFLKIICSIPVGLGVAVALVFYAYANDRFLHDHSDTSKILVSKFIDIKNNAFRLNLIEKQKKINEMQQASLVSQVRQQAHP